MIKKMIMRIPTDCLEVLVAVSKDANFRKAAETLKISQASVTNKVSQLEALFASPLFVLEGKRKVLTPFGQALCEVAEKNLKRIDVELSEVDHLYSDASSAPLRIGCRPEVFSFVAKYFPTNLTYHFVPLTGNQVAPALLESDIDIGFTSVVPDSSQLIAKKAFQSEMQLVFHKSLQMKITEMPWKNKEFMTSTPSISYGDDGHLLLNILKAYDLKLSDLNIKFTANSWTILKDLVEQGLGYSLLPNYVKTKKDVLRFSVPKNIYEPHAFYCLIRTAYREAPLFKNFLKTKWEIE